MQDRHLRKYLVKAIGRNPALRAKYEARMPALVAKVKLCKSLERAEALRETFLALPNENELQYRWRMQCLDVLAAHIRKLKRLAKAKAAPKRQRKAKPAKRMSTAQAA